MYMITTRKQGTHFHDYMECDWPRRPDYVAVIFLNVEGIYATNVLFHWMKRTGEDWTKHRNGVDANRCRNQRDTIEKDKASEP